MVDIPRYWTFEPGDLATGAKFLTDDDTLEMLFALPGEWYADAPAEGFWHLGVKIILAAGEPQERLYMVWNTRYGAVFSPLLRVEESHIASLLPDDTHQMVSLQEVVWSTMLHQIDRLLELPEDLQVRAELVGLQPLPALGIMAAVFQVTLADPAQSWLPFGRDLPSAHPQSLRADVLLRGTPPLVFGDADLLPLLPFLVSEEEPDGKLTLFVEPDEDEDEDEDD